MQNLSEKAGEGISGENGLGLILHHDVYTLAAVKHLKIHIPYCEKVF